MKNLETDLEDRKKVWDAMQMLYMDVDPECELKSIAQICASSKYSLNDLELILFNEVFPACRINLMSPIPEWTGFEIDWLAEEIIKKQRHGKRRLWKYHAYTQKLWDKLKPEILKIRPQNQ